MSSTLSKPKRKQIRLLDYDYTSNGAYHVIICTIDKQKLLSDIILTDSEPRLVLTEIGKIAEKIIRDFDKRYQSVGITEFCIMPNHIHLLVEFSGNDSFQSEHVSLGSFVSSIKGLTTKAVNKKIWQKSFYEHIIRSNADYINTIEYIQQNPAKWVFDDYYV